MYTEISQGIHEHYRVKFRNQDPGSMSSGCNVLTNDPANVPASTVHATSTIMNWAAEVRTALLVP